MSKAPQDAHYDNYVGPLLAAAGVDANTLRLCDFIYKSTWIHAVKHEREAQKETAREAMQPLPESVTGKELAASCSYFIAATCLRTSGGSLSYLCEDCPNATAAAYKAAEMARERAPFVAAVADLDTVSPSPLSPVFALITEEYHRSLAEHTPWEEAGHSADTMLKVVKAEVAEVELALSMGDYEDTVKEWVHVANVAVKAIAELTRRGRL